MARQNAPIVKEILELRLEQAHFMATQTMLVIRLSTAWPKRQRRF